jgi:murein L,D-transpeptidase YcbB/YkuD
MPRLAVVGLATVLALAGCGSNDSGDPVKRAEARVAHQERVLADAQAAFDEASSAFCQSAGSYIGALDRYGDLLHATAPTVGDVRDAGADLADPREEAIGAARTAVESHQQVVEAETELSDAQAALKSAKKGSPASSPTGSTGPAPSATPTPLAPAATVNRVKTADSDFQAALSTVTDQTPVGEASQEFNAAAVALELSWLRLFIDAGCLTDEQEEQAEAAVRTYTTALQKSLDQAGYYHGEIDGVYGPATVDAVETLQRTHDLPVTGAMDKATQAALQADLQEIGGAAAQDAVASTAAVQQTLKLAGFWDGPVDGNWTPALTDALTDFQKELGVKPTGTVDAATVSALEKAIAGAKQAGSSTPAPSPSSTPSGSAPTNGATS